MPSKTPPMATMRSALRRITGEVPVTSAATSDADGRPDAAAHERGHPGVARIVEEDEEHAESNPGEQRERHAEAGVGWRRLCSVR